MITITTSNGRRVSGATIAAACRQMFGAQKMAVKLGRAEFVPIEEASPAQLRASGAVWVSKDRTWRVGALVDDVTESPAP